ncbi:hypothetical protein [Pantoea cypripedii]|nr:hypothetical protein [Pantoea cypripedii]
MELNDGSLHIEDNITDAVWNDVKSLLLGLDDIALIFTNATVSTEIIDIPDSVSSIQFEDCDFNAPTELSGLKNGRSVIFKNCKQDLLIGNVTIKEIVCNYFEISQEGMSDSPGLLIPDINECIFSSCVCVGKMPAAFKHVSFIDKIRFAKNTKTPKIVAEITASDEEEEHEHLFFYDCIFQDYTEININIHAKISIHLESCLVNSTGEEFYPSITFPASSEIITIKIVKSNLRKLGLSLFMSSIENLSINDSTLGALQLSTIENDEKNAIYGIAITNSIVDELSLRYRDVVHALVLTDTIFNTAPQMFGAKISEGSLFPKRKYFMRRKGEHDASCYRTLRYIMESQRNRDLEGMFFSLEQESLLNTKNKLHRLFSISNMYYLLSDYGTNYRRPLLIFLLSIPLFTIIYSLIRSHTIAVELPIDWKNITNSLIFTLKQTFQPFDNLKNTQEIQKGDLIKTILLSFVAITNTLFSFLLLTLSGLAIRWRFKRG